MSTLATPDIAQSSGSTNKAKRDGAVESFGLDAAIMRARRRLLELQNPDGHWCGELQGDTILESEYVLLMAFLGREHDVKVRKAANYLLKSQRPEGGGWSNHP